jgi:hypothetical protein
LKNKIAKFTHIPLPQTSFNWGLFFVFVFKGLNTTHINAIKWTNWAKWALHFRVHTNVELVSSLD